MEKPFQASLVEQRSVIHSLTRMVENFKKLGKANHNEALVRGRLRILEDQWKRCQELDVQLQLIATPEQRAAHDYFVTEEMQVTQDAYLDAFDYFNTLLGQLTAPPSNASAPPANTPAPAPAQPPNSDLKGGMVSTVGFPSLAFPKFSGEHHEWEPFQDLFTSMVHSNASFDDVQKLQLLKMSLTGEAAHLLKNLPTTAANYPVAWDKLEAEFSNSRIIINAHLNAIVNAPPIKRGLKSEVKALRNSFNDALSALRQLDRPVDDWSDLLVFIAQQKLNSEMRRAWEKHLGRSTAFPTYEEIEEFLDTWLKVETALEYATPRTSSSARAPEQSRVRTHVASAAPAKCPLCQGDHALYACSEFKALTISDRLECVREHRCCFNCLSPSHSLNQCRSAHRCFRCKSKHHTLLHNEPPASDQDTPDETVHAHASFSVGELISTRRCGHTGGNRSVLLATAWITIQTTEGREERVRALIDPGSESTFVTESLVQTLRASRQKIDVNVAGVGGHMVERVRSCTEFVILPRACSTPKIVAHALILPRVAYPSTRRIAATVLQAQFPDLSLSDPNTHPHHPLDVLIGADLYPQIIREGIQLGLGGKLLAQNTIFGWIVCGPTESIREYTTARTRAHLSASLPMLEAAIRRFWEMEEPPSTPLLTPEEQLCEEHFLETHTRDPTGRYIVRLPFKSPPPLDLGYSKNKAKFLLERLTTRLRRSPDLEHAYRAFLKEYEEKGHMRRVDSSAQTPSQAVYIPHHAVLREDSVTTKVRVVFNASSLTTNGRALNEFLHVGPKLQLDLPLILLRWRQYPFVFSADIEQMFRQIRVDERDVDFQRILWNPQFSHSPLSYQLLTVTYGTACAPYLALRVLRQLARDEGERFPLARVVLERDFYVDDALFGAYDQKQARATRDQLLGLLSAGGFRLRKWTANQPALITDLPASERNEITEVELNEDLPVKILGLSWVAGRDVFKFRVVSPPRSQDTKRTVSSVIARLFDPLGWIAPVVVYAKILLQELWLMKGDWDDPLEGELQTRWDEYASSLSALNEIRIPRWTGQSSPTASCELHGFADASSRAFGAVVYLRVLAPSRAPIVTLLLSKTRVAPLKTVSIPRLELNAAQLLAKLLYSVIDALNLPHTRVYCWTDSSVVLAWLRKPPCTWQTFVANRVSYIQTQLPQASWRHVASHENPADCASRGLLAPDLLQHPLWWTGPAWLRQDERLWPISEATSSPQVDLEFKSVFHTGAEPIEEWSLPHRVSSWTRLLHITAYCLRFVKRTRPPASRIVPPQSVALQGYEVSEAEMTLLRYLQRHYFAADIDACLQRNPIRKPPLHRLHAFLDEQQLLRVGGRLQHSALPFSEKHPVILPAHRISELIVEDAHRRTLHGGPQLTLRVLRQRFWLLGARNIVRKLIHRCVPCARRKAVVPSQQMGVLPSARVTPQRPFSHCGVDFAGPVFVLPITGRGQRSRKAYIAIFICLCTRAVHLELVGDNSTETFLLAFRRFVSRRGLPSDLYSDNGTNFHGADHSLARDWKSVVQDASLLSTLASDRVNWHFIPPAAPHFGGLWEAGVKSLKHHLSRVLGTRTLSIEEFTTLLTQIEACMNSRPIGPLPSDPDDTAPLTPGHFLIGAPLVTIPEPSTLQLQENRLNRWQVVRRALEEFWQSWSQDYLHTLQQRAKWTHRQHNVQEGELVLLRNGSLPPAKWDLGRVISVHPGPDGLVRVVTIRTTRGTSKRPITQLVRLPIEITTPHTAPAVSSRPPCELDDHAKPSL